MWLNKSWSGPGVSRTDLHDISRKSCQVLETLGLKIQGVESYVTGNKIDCVYIASDAAMIRKHAEMGEFPMTAVNEIKQVIDPTTAE